jgi:hypothetical protein
MKTIAGLMFTETGIVIERPFVENPSVKKMIAEDKFTGEFLELAKRIIKARMAHCYRKLHSNLANAKHVTPDMIAWEGGHFNVGVWEELEMALELDDARKLNTIQCQQIIRAILLDEVGNWAYDYDTTTWTRFDKGDKHITQEFRNFVTEQILVGMQPVVR